MSTFGTTLFGPLSDIPTFHSRSGELMSNLILAARNSLQRARRATQAELGLFRSPLEFSAEQPQRRVIEPSASPLKLRSPVQHDVDFRGRGLAGRQDHQKAAAIGERRISTPPQITLKQRLWSPNLRRNTKLDFHGH
jgi:hypothetical protein